MRPKIEEGCRAEAEVVALNLWDSAEVGGIGIVNYGALFRSAMVTLLRNKMRSILTVLGITIGIAAVICVVAIGNAGQARVQQHLNNLGDNFVWIEAGGRAVNGVRTGTHDTKTLVMADAVAIKNQVSLIKSVSPNVDDPCPSSKLRASAE
jgi:putative ABC transport system permease protein